MPYFLYKTVATGRPRVEIAKERYDALREAWHSLFRVCQIEEIWDDLIQNYTELEIDVLRVSLERMTARSMGYVELHDASQLLGRRLSNLLQSCRAYLDYVPRSLAEIPGPDLVQFFESQRVARYAADFDFRLVSELRNHSQHRGSPIHGASHGAEWVGRKIEEGESPSQFRFSVTLFIDPARLASDERCPKALRMELDALPGELDAIAAVRGFVECLGDIHARLRREMREALTLWASDVRAAIAEYGEAADRKVVGLSIGEFTDDKRNPLETQPLFENLPIRVEALIRRNGSLENLRKRYVTSELAPSKK